jgi:hypothetical protein
LDPERPNSPQGFEDDLLAHLGIPHLAIHKYNRELNQLEASEKSAVLEFNLKRISIRPKRADINRLEHLPAPTVEASREILNRSAENQS